MKVPWSSGSLTEPPVEHFQHLEDDPESIPGQDGEEEGGGGGEEDEELPAGYPYPRFWQRVPDYY